MLTEVSVQDAHLVGRAPERFFSGKDPVVHASLFDVSLIWLRTKRARRAGRRSNAVRDLIVWLARENASWGYVRIVGEVRLEGDDLIAVVDKRAQARMTFVIAKEREADPLQLFADLEGAGAIVAGACHLVS